MITKTSLKNSSHYEMMLKHGDFAQPGVFDKDTAIRFNHDPSKFEFLEFETDNDWALSTFTISVWAYITAFYDMPLLCLNTNTVGDGIHYYSRFNLATSKSSPGYPSMTGYTANGLLGTIYTNKSYSLNEWTHIVFVKNANKKQYIFINGKLSSNNSYADPDIAYETWSNKPKITIGYYSSTTNRICGLIDDLVVTKDVLWTSDFTVPDKPMSELYPNTDFLLNLYQVGPYSYGPNSILKVY